MSSILKKPYPILASATAPAGSDKVMVFQGDEYKLALFSDFGGSGDLVSTNNLSDVLSAATSLSNLGGQPLATVLTNTTASFTTAQETKLSGIEALADVTDAVNVAAAGAAMTANNLSDLASAATARGNLGIGSIATQAASAVALTGGAIDGTLIGGTTPAAGTFTGVYLGGTIAANLLDDYEEGSFTWTLSDAAGAGNNATATALVGRYTKIGRIVFVTYRMLNINTTGMTAGNVLYCKGLPFTATATDSVASVGTVRGSTITPTDLRTYIAGGAASMRLLTGNDTYLTVGDLTSPTADIFGSVFYETDL